MYLISRLLASTNTSCSVLCQTAYSLLRRARTITHKWMREIIQKQQNATDDDEASELQRHACEIAATCRATFDVDIGPHMEALLHSASDVFTLVECAIVVHDNTPPQLDQAQSHLKKLLYRDRRLSHHLEQCLLRCIDLDRTGLDIAITSVWPGYRPGSPDWQKLEEPNARWLTAFTAPVKGQRSQQVHYNIFEGKLLVDGKPLGRLPRDITSHSTYRRILGQVKPLGIQAH